MFIDIKDLSSAECYQALIASVIPRPIAWVSTLSEKGVGNLAPYSFFTVASCKPAVLSITHIQPRATKQKDTLVNLLATKECVVNIVNQTSAELMNATSQTFDAEVDEFDEVGVKKIESRFVNAFGVAQSPVRYECKLREVIPISNEPLGGNVILLDVLAIHIDDKCLTSAKINIASIDAVGKLNGDLYSTTDSIFSLERPS